MLRFFVLLLVLLNALFFGWTQGWLGPKPRQSESEPERLAAQVRPDSLTVLPPTAANAALQAARVAALVCLEAGPFAEANLSAAQAVLAQAQLPEAAWERVDTAPAPVWLVFAGRYPEAGLRKVREDDLRKLDLKFELIETPAELAPGFVLSRHATREQAQAWVNAKSSTALRGVRVVQLPSAPGNLRLRVARADTEQADRLRALPAEALAGGFRPCVAKP